MTKTNNEINARNAITAFQAAGRLVRGHSLRDITGAYLDGGRYRLEFTFTNDHVLILEGLAEGLMIDLQYPEPKGK